MNEFNLSDKITFPSYNLRVAPTKPVIDLENVKEFIKLYKKETDKKLLEFNEENDFLVDIRDMWIILDKLAGDKLK